MEFSDFDTNYSDAIGTVSGKRKSIQFTARKTKTDVSRFITVISPTEDGSLFKDKISINSVSSQLDGNKVPLSTEIEVKVDNKDYELKYTLQ